MKEFWKYIKLKLLQNHIGVSKDNAIISDEYKQKGFTINFDITGNYAHFNGDEDQSNGGFINIPIQPNKYYRLRHSIVSKFDVIIHSLPFNVTDGIQYGGKIIQQNNCLDNTFFLHHLNSQIHI